MEMMKMLNEGDNKRIKVIDLDKMVDVEVDCQILEIDELNALLMTHSVSSLKKLRESLSVNNQQEFD